MAGSWVMGLSDPCLRCSRTGLQGTQRTGIRINIQTETQTSQASQVHQKLVDIFLICLSCSTSHLFQDKTQHSGQMLSSHRGQRARGFSIPSHHGAETTGWLWHEFLSSLQSPRCCRGAQRQREVEFFSCWSKVDGSDEWPWLYLVSLRATWGMSRGATGRIRNTSLMVASR